MEWEEEMNRQIEKIDESKRERWKPRVRTGWKNVWRAADGAFHPVSIPRGWVPLFDIKIFGVSAALAAGRSETQLINFYLLSIIFRQWGLFKRPRITCDLMLGGPDPKRQNIMTRTHFQVNLPLQKHTFETFVYVSGAIRASYKRSDDIKEGPWRHSR